jgi:hypothetical protein
MVSVENSPVTKILVPMEVCTGRDAVEGGGEKGIAVLLVHEFVSGS